MLSLGPHHPVPSLSRADRFIRGVSLAWLTQALTLAVGLVLTPFLLRQLGESEYGLWLVASQSLAYLNLLDIGTVALLPRATAYAVGRGLSGEAVGQELALALRLALWQMPLLALAAAVLWICFGWPWPELRLPLAAVLLVYVACYPLRVFAAVLTGLQDFSYAGLVHFAAWLLGTAATVLLLLRGAGLEALAAGWILSHVLAAAACFQRLRRRFPAVVPRDLPTLEWAAARDRLRQGAWVSLAQLAQLLLNSTDLVLIAWILGPAAVVPYALTAKLTSVLANQPQVLAELASPSLSEHKAAGDRDRALQVAASTSQILLLISGAVALFILGVNEGFVGWWVGREHFGGLPLTLALVAAMMVRHLSTTLVYTTFAFGYERHISLVTLADGVVTVASAAVLVRLFGPIGAPAGAALGALLISIPLHLSVLARETTRPVSALLRPLLPILTRVFLLGIGVGVVASYWTPGRAPGLLLLATGIGVAYVLVMGAVLLRPPIAAYVRPWLERLRGRRKDRPQLSS